MTTLRALLRTLLLVVCCGLLAAPARADLRGALAALDAHRLSALQAELARTPLADPADHQYVTARLAAARYRTTAAIAAARACERAARDDIRRSRCAEAEAEALGLEVALNGGDYATLGRAGRLQSQLARAVRLDRNNARAAMLLARFHRVASWLVGGSHREADRGLANAARLQPALADEWRGIDAYDGKDYPRAIALLRRAHSPSALRPNTGYYLALALDASGDGDGARVVLRDVVRRHPEFLEGVFQLGVWEVDTAPQRAAELLRRFAAGAPDAGDKRLSKCYRQLGNAEEKLGHRNAAIQAFRTALRLRPADDIAQDALVRLGAAS